jgi:hypothetical protein
MLKKALITIAFMLASSLAYAPAGYAFNPFGDTCSGNGKDSSICKYAGKTGTTDPVSGPNGIIQKTANLIAIIAGIAAVVVIIIGGIGFITSGGSSDKTATARKRIIYAVVGLVIVALAWTIVTFIITKLINT